MVWQAEQVLPNVTGDVDLSVAIWHDVGFHQTSPQHPEMSVLFKIFVRYPSSQLCMHVIKLLLVSLGIQREFQILEAVVL